MHAYGPAAYLSDLGHTTTSDNYFRNFRQLYSRAGLTGNTRNVGAGCRCHCSSIAFADNDIAVVGEALAKQGFEVLPPIKDARRSAILAGVGELTRKLNTAGAGAIGFLYYSGHAAAEKDTNINYLISVDAKEPVSLPSGMKALSSTIF